MLLIFVATLRLSSVYVRKMGQLLSSFKAGFSSAFEPPLALILGLDDSGKTTLFYKMIDLPNPDPPGPTDGINFATYESGGSTVCMYEMAGRPAHRALWIQKLANAALLVWIIDMQNPSRFEESKLALSHALDQLSVNSVPLLIIANKRSEELDDKTLEGPLAPFLALPGTQTRYVGVFGCDTVSGHGVSAVLAQIREMATQLEPTKA